MGNQSQVINSQRAHILNKQKDLKLRITYHRHSNIPELLRIFRLFIRQPFLYIYRIDLIVQQENCCNHTILKVGSPVYSYNLETLLTAKRKVKGFFVEKQIWYIIKSIIKNLAYMQANGVVLGNFNPRAFNLQKGRFISPQILHILPHNQHDSSINLHNYYSPQKLRQASNQQLMYGRQQKIDIFKNQVFSFGLLILEISTCPSTKPKFHKANLRQLLWNNIGARFEVMQQKYSQKLSDLVQMTLRQDVRVRPDWNYLRVWMTKNEPFIDVAPCIFWSI